MDELFGSSGIGSAPASTICSTPLVLDEVCSQNTATHTPHSSEEQPGMDDIPGPSGTQNMVLNPSRRRRPVSQPSFYETFEAHAERRTAVLETLVQPDLQRWRRLKEKRRRSFEKKKKKC